MGNWGPIPQGNSERLYEVHFGIVPLRHKDAGVFIHQLLPHTGWDQSQSIKSLAFPAYRATTHMNWAPSQDQRPLSGRNTKYLPVCRQLQGERGETDGITTVSSTQCEEFWVLSQLISLLSMLKLSAFYKGGNWGSERLRNMPRVTQQVQVSGIQILS